MEYHLRTESSVLRKCEKHSPHVTSFIVLIVIQPKTTCGQRKISLCPLTFVATSTVRTFHPLSPASPQLLLQSVHSHEVSASPSSGQQARSFRHYQRALESACARLRSRLHQPCWLAVAILSTGSDAFARSLSSFSLRLSRRQRDLINNTIKLAGLQRSRFFHNRPLLGPLWFDCGADIKQPP